MTSYIYFDFFSLPPRLFYLKLCMFTGSCNICVASVTAPSNQTTQVNLRICQLQIIIQFTIPPPRYTKYIVILTVVGCGLCTYRCAASQFLDLCQNVNLTFDISDLSLFAFGVVCHFSTCRFSCSESVNAAMKRL